MEFAELQFKVSLHAIGQRERPGDAKLKYLSSLLTLVLLGTSSAHSNACSAFEQKVFELTDEAMRFPQDRTFYEFGWSAKGPTDGWLERWKALSEEKEKTRDFLFKYEFALGDVYSVVDEYRTFGSLDTYFSEIEEIILTATRCSD